MFLLLAHEDSIQIVSLQLISLGREGTVQHKAIHSLQW